MLQPKKIPTPSEVLGSRKAIPSPSDILGVQEKKKDDSTVIDTNSDSETNIGSSVGKNIDKNPNAKMKQFTGFSNSETEILQGKKPIPQINQSISKQLNPKGFEINKLRKKLSDTKVTSENMLDVDKDTNKLIQLEKEQELAYKEKMEAIGGSLFDKVYTHDKELSLQNLENEKNDNQFIDYAREIGKGAVNMASDVLNETLVTPLNAVISGGDKEEFEKKPFFQPFDKFDKFKPLEKAKAQALKENPNLSNDANALEKEAEKIYLQEDAKRQYKKNATDLLQNTDPDIQEAVKSYQIKKLNLKNYDLEANLVRVQLVDKKFENLKKQFEQNKTKENADLLNTAKAEYISILKEQDVLSKDINDVKQNIDLFKLNYNPYEKFLNGIASASTKMVGGAMALSAELSPVQGLFPNATKAYAQAGRDLVDIANQNDSEYRRVSLDDVETTGEYGRYIAQLFSEQVPNLLVASTGYGGLAMLGAGSGGQKTIEMRKEMELNPKKYSEAQVKVAGVAFFLAEAILEVNTMNMIKGATNTLKSISMDVAERTLFQKGIKDFALNFSKNVVVKPIYKGNKEGFSEGFTGIMQDYVDEKILGNKIKNKKEKRIEEYVSGFILGDGMTAFAEMSSFVGYVASLVSTESEMLDIKNRVAKINQLEKELQKEGLFESDIKILKEDLDIAYKGLKQKSIENTKNIENLSKLQIEELVKSNVRQTEIRQEVEVLRNGNLSKEIKQAKAEELKQEFIANEEKRNGIKNGNLTSVDLLPLKEQDQIKRQALEDLVLELNPDGSKNITISNEQIVKRANKIYKESIKNEEKLNQEVKDAETESTTTNETQPKAEVQEPIVSKQAEVDGNYIYEGKEYIVKDGSITDIEGNLLPLDFSSEESFYSKITTKGEKIDKKKSFADAGNQSKKDQSPKALGDFIIDNSQVGDKIRINKDSYYEVVSKKTNKKGHTETELQLFIKNEETGKFENIPSAVKLFTDKYRGTDLEKLGYKDASDLFESSYTNSNGERVTEQSIYEPKSLKSNTQEAKVEDVVAPSVAEITKDEYNNFVDNNVVSEERLVDIAEKVKTQIPLTEQENAIFTGKTTEINNIIASEGVQKGNTDNNGNLPIGDNTDLQQRQVEAVQPTSNVGESKNNSNSRKEERIKVAVAKIDDYKNAIQGIDEIFGFKIKVDDIDSLNKNGIDIVEVIASIVKQAVTAGIEIDEAISKAVAHFKKTIDFEIDIDELKKRVQDAEKSTDKKDNKKEQRLAEKIKNYPRQGEFKSYLSQETMEEAHGSVQKDEGYDAVVLVQVGNYGQELVQDAKELYGENYVQELIKLIDSENFRLDEQSLILISLENHIADKLKVDTNNGQLNKLQSFVQGKSKVISNIGSKVVNFGRIRNIMNIGFDVEGQQEKALSDKKKQAKKSIKKVIAKVNSQSVNKQDEIENSDVEEDDFVIEAPKNKRDKKIVQKELADVWKNMLADVKKAGQVGANDVRLNSFSPLSDKQIKVATPYIIKSSKLLAEMAIYSTKEIIDEIYNNLIDTFPDIKKENVKEILQQKAREGKKLTPEEVEAKKLANRIKNTEQKITDLENNVQKDNTGKSSEWSKELSEAKSKLAILQQKAREGKISNVVKQALIEAGFGRKVNVKTKNGKEVRELLDWTLLAGEESSVDSIEKNVLSVLKDKYTPKQLTDINSQLKEEYNRLSAKIIEKGFNDLEKLNQITPSSKRKTESKRLAELYNKGLFESNEYNTLLNKVLGLSPYEIEIQDKIKSQAQALADLYATKLPNGKRLSEIAISNIASDITHNINQLLSTLSRERGGKLFNTVQLYGDVAVMSQKAMLGGIPNLIENFTSAKYQGLLSQNFLMNGNLTPELKEQIKKDKNVIYNDIVKNAGLFYGDTNSSLFSQSRFEDWINGKIDNKLGHVVFSVISLRMFLEAQDSQIKVQLTSNYFIKNLLDTLTSKSNPNGAMKKDDALAYINKELTGDSFEKALISAKNIIDDINSKQKDGNVLKDDKDAVYRFAMGIVKQNLASDRVLSMDEIEGSFKAGYKSAGRDIGHEANNIVTLGVNYINRMLNKELQDSIRNEHYGVATLVSALSSIYRFTVSPFVGGGTNWIVLQAQKGGLSPMGILGVVQTIADYTRKQPFELDLNTELGRKNYVNSLYRKTNYQASMARQLVGTITGLAMMTAMSVDFGDDEDATDKVVSWLSENEWARKYFDKISPSTIVWLTYLREDDLTKFFTRQLNIKTDYYDRNYQVIKSLGNDQDTGAKVAEATTANLIAPFAWKTTADLYDITNGLLGNSPINKEDSSEDFIDALFKNGAVSRFTRIIDNFRENYNEYYENEDLE